jgi:hypothetical protein
MTYCMVKDVAQLVERWQMGKGQRCIDDKGMKTKELRETPALMRFFHHEFHLKSTEIESGSVG